MQSEKEKVALGSIAASAGLTLAKGVVGVLTGSLAILSEAAHSLIDFGATVMTYFAVRISGKPADEEHHYGHGKVESVSALAETALLFVLSGVVIWEAVKRLHRAIRAHVVEATVAAFAVIIVSVVVDFFRARLLYRVASETASEALEADALHFGSDMWSSIAVLVGLGGVAFGYQWADSAAAVVVAVFVCIAGWRLGRRTIETLTDTAPPGSAETVRRIAGRVSGVVGVDGVRVRPVGDKLFVEVVLAVSRTLPLDRVEALKVQVAKAIRTEMPRAEVGVDAAPRALDDETVQERVMVIARNQGLAVHHVTVHDIRGKRSGLARSRGRPQAGAGLGARDRRQAGGGAPRGARARRRGRNPHRAAAAAGGRRPRGAAGARPRSRDGARRDRRRRRHDPRRAQRAGPRNRRRRDRQLPRPRRSGARGAGRARKGRRGRARACAAARPRSSG